jgi:hypothetical protein
MHTVFNGIYGIKPTLNIVNTSQLRTGRPTLELNFTYLSGKLGSLSSSLLSLFVLQVFQRFQRLQGCEVLRTLYYTALLVQPA